MPESSWTASEPGVPRAYRAQVHVPPGTLSGNFDDDAPHLAESLAGPVEPDPSKHEDVPWSVFCEQLMAGVAMGIAIGQLVSPDVFKTGGAR